MYGNLFIGNDTKGAKGVTVYHDRHMIYNNLFVMLSGNGD
jgi:hypothetical protein